MYGLPVLTKCFYCDIIIGINKICFWRKTKMRKLTAILLALAMLVSLCLASCSDKPDIPVVPGGDTNNAGGDTTTNGGGSTGPVGTTEYYPDSTADFGGWFAIASAGGPIYFDNVKGVAVVGKIGLFEHTFDEEGANLDAFTAISGNIADWSIVDEPVFETEAEEADEAETEEEAEPVNKVLTTSGEGAIKFGGADWNRVQLTSKIMLTEESGGAEIYFGYEDENNYYVVNLGNGSNSSVNVTHVADGKASVDTIDLSYTLPVGEWVNISVVLNPNTVTLYVAGAQLFEVYDVVEADDVYYGGIGFGTWSTSYSIDNIKISSYLTGEVMYENDFTGEDLAGWESYVAADGAWATVTDGGDWHDDWVITTEEGEHGDILQCISTSITGGGIMLTESLGNADWNNYVFEFDARKDGGAEGFMPYFAVTDWTDPSKADYVRWNQGGWANTLSCYQTCTDGSITNRTQVSDTYTVGEWYHVTIYIINNVLYGCVNGQLINIHIN